MHKRIAFSLDYNIEDVKSKVQNYRSWMRYCKYIHRHYKITNASVHVVSSCKQVYKVKNNIPGKSTR